jgi:hypothetical protein
VGLQRGDLLLAIDDRPVSRCRTSSRRCTVLKAGTSARYTVLRLGTREVVDLRIAPGARTVPGRSTSCSPALAMFTLLVGGAVRLRRPRDPATLHFFWLSVVFFGVFTFSFSGRLDRLDWVFYWGDAISILLLPPLFLHFALVFPERGRRWTSGNAGRVIVPLVYLPALLLLTVRVTALVKSASNAPRFLAVIASLDRAEYLYSPCVSSQASSRSRVRSPK